MNVFLHIRRVTFLLECVLHRTLFQGAGLSSVVYTARQTENRRERERGKQIETWNARMFWDKPIHSGLVSLSDASDSTKVFCLADCGLGHHG